MAYCPFVTTYVSVLKGVNGTDFISENQLVPFQCAESLCQCWGGSDCGLKASNLQSYIQQKDLSDAAKAAEEDDTTSEESDIPDIPYYVPLINEFMGNEDRDGDGKLYGRDFKITDDDKKPIALKGLEEHPDWIEPTETITWPDYIASIKALKKTKDDEEDTDDTDDTPVEKIGYRCIKLQADAYSWQGRYNNFNSVRFILSKLEMFEEDLSKNILDNFNTGNIYVRSEYASEGHFKEHAIDNNPDTYWDSNIDTGPQAYITFDFGTDKKLPTSIRLKSLKPSNMSFRGVCLPMKIFVLYTDQSPQQDNWSTLGYINTEDTSDEQSHTIIKI